MYDQREENLRGLEVEETAKASGFKLDSWKEKANHANDTYPSRERSINLQLPFGFFFSNLCVRVLFCQVLTYKLWTVYFWVGNVEVTI